MLNYNDFIFEEKLDYLLNSINENSEEDIIDKITNIINYALEKGEKYLLPTINKIFNYFKKNKRILIFILVLLMRLDYSEHQLVEMIGNTKENIELIEIAKEESITNVDSKGDLNDFLYAIAKRESSNNPKCVNTLGYIGKYQFGKLALKDVGLYPKITSDKFRKNTNIWPEKEQDKAMVKLLKLNKKYLGKYFNDFINKEVAGIKITKSGLLAASHLLGAGNVKKFLKSNGKHIPKDGYGTPLTEYLSKFSEYELNEI